MRPIAILEHSANVPPGYLAEAIAAAGLPSEVVRLHAGDQLPGPGAASAVVSLGGIMGAHDEEEYPFLADEKLFLRMAVQAGTPVLGICLGCQLLADALGGRAYRAETLEAEFVGLQLTAVGRTDSVVQTLGAPVVSFHEDTWEPPPGAQVLATSKLYPHVFRYGSALAIQAHPEATPEMFEEWVAGHGPDQMLAAGVDPDEFLSRIHTGAADNEARAAALFGRWFEEIASALR